MMIKLAHKIVRFMMKFFFIFPIKKNRILFLSQKGHLFGCNPRYIYEKLYEDFGSDIQYIWCLQSIPDELQGKQCVRIIPYNSVRHFYYQMTSKVIIINIPSPIYIPKRHAQLTINTWHGGGAYKKVGIACPKQDSLNSNIIGINSNLHWEWYKAKYNAKDTDFFVSSSNRFAEVMYDSQMLPRSAYLEFGMPRNDIFFHDFSFVKSKAKAKLGISEDKKVLFFAPTYRGNSKKQKFSMNLDVEKCLKSVEDKWGGDWVFVFRVHVGGESNLINVSDKVYNASEYNEMQELLCLADVFITDYSSSMWDFSLTKKPAFLFTPDLEYYLKADRGFYTDINDWPFPFANTNEELVILIENFNREKHVRRVEHHLHDFGSFEKGNATERTCKLILKELEVQ